jgi:predicted dehydrogenase
VGEPLGPALGVGLVGCGYISGQYLATLATLPALRLVAVADQDPARAKSVAEQRGDARALSTDDLVRADDVDVVLNLTTPEAHAAIAARAVAAGKDVYGEKPLALTTAEASAVLTAGAAAGVRLGCAPDTVLGTGIQTARRVLDDGRLGIPTAATAVMVTAGHERWHPHPDFYYLPGGGPLYDMGPYYLSALITLFGPVQSLTAMASRSRDSRMIGQGPRAGERIPVTVDTHVTGVLRHANGVLTTLLMSFDGVGTAGAAIEVHGTEGSMVVPDPNQFTGDVTVYSGHTPGELVAPNAGWTLAARGYGLADLAATAPGAEPRAGGLLAYHVLDVMESMLTSAQTGQAVEVASTCARPAPVPFSNEPPS